MATRSDPTRTALLRHSMARDISKRYRQVAQEVRQLVDEQDIFGLRPGVQLIRNAQDWRFLTSDKKLAQFQRWFQKMVDDKVLTTDTKGDPWTAKYVNSAYRKGMTRAFVDARGKELKKSADFFEGTKEQFLRSAFSNPERLSKIRMVATRAFENLRGVNAAMATQMNQILANGLAQGKNPRQIGREMAKKIDGLTKSRALTIARTEIVHAHAEGQPDSFEELGVDVQLYAEWSTAGDDRVCPACATNEGVILKVKEARGLIPLHPNCRCAWLPADMPARKRAKKKGKDKAPLDYSPPEGLAFAGAEFYHGSPYSTTGDFLEQYESPRGMIFVTPNRRVAEEYTKELPASGIRPKAGHENRPTVYSLQVKAPEHLLFDTTNPEHLAIYEEIRKEYNKKVDPEDRIAKNNLVQTPTLTGSTVSKGGMLPGYGDAIALSNELKARGFRGVWISEGSQGASLALFDPKQDLVQNKGIPRIQGPVAGTAKDAVRRGLLAGLTEADLHATLKAHYVKEVGPQIATDEFVAKKLKMWRPILRRELTKKGITIPAPGTGKVTPPPGKGKGVGGPKDQIRQLMLAGKSDEEIFQALRAHYVGKGLTDDTFIRKRVKGLQATIRRELKKTKPLPVPGKVTPPPKEGDKVKELMKGLLKDAKSYDEILAAFKEHYARKGIHNEEWIKNRVKVWLPIARRELKKEGTVVVGTTTPKATKAKGPVAPKGKAKMPQSFDALLKEVKTDGILRPGSFTLNAGAHDSSLSRLEQERQQKAFVNTQLAPELQKRGKAYINADPVLAKMWDSTPRYETAATFNVAKLLTDRVRTMGLEAIPADERATRKKAFIDAVLKKAKPAAKKQVAGYHRPGRGKLLEYQIDRLTEAAGNVFDKWGPVAESALDRLDHLLYASGRAYNADNAFKRMLTWSDRNSFAHELGHSIENYINSRKEVDTWVGVGYWHSRIEGKDPTTQRLRDVEPLGGYGPDEMTRKDKWSVAYMGKEYNRSSTEVVSMLTEYYGSGAAAYGWRDQFVSDREALEEYVGWMQASIQGEVKRREEEGE